MTEVSSRRAKSKERRSRSRSISRKGSSKKRGKSNKAATRKTVGKVKDKRDTGKETKVNAVPSTKPIADEKSMPSSKKPYVPLHQRVKERNTNEKSMKRNTDEKSMSSSKKPYVSLHRRLKETKNRKGLTKVFSQRLGGVAGVSPPKSEKEDLLANVGILVYEGAPTLGAPTAPITKAAPTSIVEEELVRGQGFNGIINPSGLLPELDKLCSPMESAGLEIFAKRVAAADESFPSLESTDIRDNNSSPAFTEDLSLNKFEGRDVETSEKSLWSQAWLANEMICSSIDKFDQLLTSGATVCSNLVLPPNKGGRTVYSDQGRTVYSDPGPITKQSFMNHELHAKEMFPKTTSWPMTSRDAMLKTTVATAEAQLAKQKELEQARKEAAADALRAKEKVEMRLMSQVQELKWLEANLQKESQLSGELKEQISKLKSEVEKEVREAQEAKAQADMKIKAQTQKMEATEARLKTATEKNHRMYLEIDQLKNDLSEARAAEIELEQAQAVGEVGLQRAKKEAEKKTKALANELKALEDKLKVESQQNSSLKSQMSKLKEEIVVAKADAQKIIDLQHEELSKLEMKVISALKTDVEKEKGLIGSNAAQATPDNDMALQKKAEELSEKIATLKEKRSRNATPSPLSHMHPCDNITSQEITTASGGSVTSTLDSSVKVGKKKGMWFRKLAPSPALGDVSRTEDTLASSQRTRSKKGWLRSNKHKPNNGAGGTITSKDLSDSTMDGSAEFKQYKENINSDESNYSANRSEDLPATFKSNNDAPEALTSGEATTTSNYPSSLNGTKKSLGAVKRNESPSSVMDIMNELIVMTRSSEGSKKVAGDVELKDSFFSESLGSGTMASEAECTYTSETIGEDWLGSAAKSKESEVYLNNSTDSETEYTCSSETTGTMSTSSGTDTGGIMNWFSSFMSGGDQESVHNQTSSLLVQ